MCTIKVQVPRPVCVVVPPTTLELSEGKKKRERERGEYSRGIYLEIWSHTALYTLPAWASSMGKPRLTSVPVCADGRGTSHEEAHRVPELYVYM